MISWSFNTVSQIAEGMRCVSSLGLSALLTLVMMTGAYSQCAPTTDCNANGVLDSCDLSLGTSDDCDSNGIPDECDIALGNQLDCNLNGIPDSCEPPSPQTPMPTGGFSSATSVSISGDFAVVGSPADSSIAPNAGSAHVFRRVGTIWVEEGTELTASDAADGDLFGSSVSIDGDLIAVGAPGVDLGAVTDAGAVYVFRRVAGVWTQESKLTRSAPVAEDELGDAVSASGSRVLTGAPMTGAPGTDKGVGLIFFYNGSSWAIEASIAPAGLQAGDHFGAAVHLSSTHAFISAPRRTAGGLVAAGEVQVVELLTGTWTLTDTLNAPTPQTGAEFGRAVAGTDESLAVGAPEQDSAAGAVHVFEKVGGTWTANQELASPATPASQRLGTSVSISAQFLLIGESETTATTLGMTHVYSRGSGSWSFDATLSEGVLGDLFGEAVATDDRYGLVAAPGAPTSSLHWIDTILDCNSNGIDDDCDISSGTETDCNQNGIPDSCDGITDTTLPVISNLPANLAVDNSHGLCTGVASWVEPIATDDCQIASLVADTPPGSSFPLGETTVTYTATDTTGNVATASFTVTVMDPEPPVISNLPSNITMNAAAGTCAASTFWATPTATDNCGVATFGSTLPSGSSFPLGNTPVSYIATDTSGNTTFGTFIVTIHDAEAPQISGVPGDIAVTAAPGTCSQVVTWTEPTTSDLCGASSLNSNVSPGASFSVGVTTVLYTATDLAGNMTTASFTVTVLDADAPSLVGLPINQTISAPANACTATASWTEPLVIDPCGGTSLSSDFASGSDFPLGMTVVTYTASDASGNITQGSFTVTVIDVTGPAAAGVPSSLSETIGAGACESTVTWVEPTFTDNCGVDSINQTHTPGQVFPLGSTTVSYTATDTSGNPTTVSFDVNVVDVDGPTIANLPADIVVPNPSDACSGIANWTPPTPSDPCGVASLTSDVPPGSVFPAGVSTVTYTAVDNNGNNSTASFTVTLEDTIPPTLINVPADMTLPSTPGFCGTVPIWTAPQPVDNCGIQSITSNIQPGTFFQLGTTTVTYTATDLGNNVTTASFDVTVEDTDGPVFASVPADIVITLTPGICSQAVNWIPPVAADPCGLSTIFGDLSPGSDLGAGVTTVTYTATDTNGNVSTASFTITIIDPEPPTLSGLPSPITVSNTLDSCGAFVTWVEPTGSDSCGAVNLSSTAASGSFFPVGLTTVTYTATDIAGNQVSASFDVTVNDDELPSISNLPVGGVNVTTANNQCSGVANWADPIPTDNCGVQEIVGSHTPSSTFPVGTTVVTYTVTDVSGNVANLSFDVNIIDDDAPTISALPVLLSAVTEPDLCGATVNWAAPSTNDNCGVVNLTSTHQPGDFFPLGSTVVTYTATDQSGNNGTRTLTINVSDNQPPVITGAPANTSVFNDPGQCFATVNWTPPSATDNCGVTSFTSTHQPGSLFSIGQTLVAYSAVDDAGQSVSVTFIVEVTDNESPFLSIGGDLNATPQSGECVANLTIPIGVATDNCNVASLTNDYTGTGDASGAFPIGTTVVTWTATDEHGNSTTAAQTVTVDIPPGSDCNNNGIPDACDIDLGTSLDCNSNGIPDDCDITSGVGIDANANGVIDACEAIFVRGDINADATINIADGIYLLSTLFTMGQNPPCLDSADVNDDGLLDISDVIFTIGYIFSGGSAPAAPFPDCGLDQTGGDFLDCDEFVPCL